MAQTNTLCVKAWNMHCMYDIGRTYVKILACDAHIVILNEHGLFPCEVQKLRRDFPEFDFTNDTVKTSARLSDEAFGSRQGIGGCALLWKKSISHLVTPLKIENTDRLVAVKIKTSPVDNISLIGMYLPHSTCKISNFSYEVAILESTIIENPRSIAMGDTNCSISKKYGPRGSEKQGPNSNKIMTAMNRCDMECRDLQEDCHGPCYTYSHSKGETYIDHVFVSRDLIYDVYDCQVIPEDFMNCSDHLPLAITIGMNHTIGPDRSFVPRTQVAWHKAPPEEIRSRYTKKSDDSLLQTWADINSRDNLDPFLKCSEMVSGFVGCLNEAATALPHTKFNKKLKPEWDPSLTKLNKEMKRIRWEWILAGKPREKGNTHWENYKDSKRQFRRQHRRNLYSYETKEMKDLGGAVEMDQAYFWWMYNKTKGTLNQIQAIYNESGSILTEPNSIRCEWTNYYKGLYNWESDSNNDKEFESLINREIADYYSNNEKMQYLRGGKIRVDEVIKQVKLMKNRKAPGHDNITAEHLKHLGEKGMYCLTDMLNCMIECECVPAELKKGLLCPLPKPGKNPMFKDCNRGITLLSTVYKLLERIIIDREKDWFDGVRSELQGAGVDNCSSLHTSMLLQETIAYNRNKGETVHIVWKDIHKAFDHVWLEGLLFKLYKLGMHFKTWCMIRECYTNFVCAAFIGGECGEWFPVTRGVHQGAPYSMILYEFFVNDLLIELRSSRHGIRIFDIDATCPSFADDISTLALHKPSMNALLKISHDHSKKWRYSFSYDKCNGMIIGPDSCPNRDIMIGNSVLECKEMVKHVGITVCKESRLLAEVIDEKIATGRKILFGAKGIGSYTVPVSPTIMSKLYWSVVIPKVTYGFELYVLNDSCISALEEAHRFASKTIQMLPVSSPNPTHIALLGWLSMDSYISMKKILFIWRILSLPCDDLYRRILKLLVSVIPENNQVPYISPVYDMFLHVCKYGLQGYLKHFLSDDVSIKYSVWKKRIKSLVWSYETAKWNATCMLYPELDIYRHNIESIGMHMWWKFVVDNPIYMEKASAVLAIMCNVQPKRLQRNFKSDRAGCLLCKDRVVDDFRHTFSCPSLTVSLNIFWRSVEELMPFEIRHIYDSLPSRIERIGFILSGFRSKYNRDWYDCYVRVLDSTWTIFKARASAIDSLNMP